MVFKDYLKKQINFLNLQYIINVLLSIRFGDVIMVIDAIFTIAKVCREVIDAFISEYFMT